MKTLVGIILATFAIGAFAQGDAGAPPYPPPGRVVDVGGWKLHLNCTGRTNPQQPTVILESGVDDFSVEWSLVQPGVAREKGGRAASVRTRGSFLRRCARPSVSIQYPADVAGMVLVEAGTDNPLRMKPDGQLVHATTSCGSSNCSAAFRSLLLRLPAGDDDERQIAEGMIAFQAVGTQTSSSFSNGFNAAATCFTCPRAHVRISCASGGNLSRGGSFA